MSENKPSRYLAYAIGEIVLVVIGILIALSINNWNEGNKLKKIEEHYLEDLKSDINLEIQNNSDLIKVRWATAKAASEMIDFKVLQTASDLLALERSIQAVFQRVNFIPTNNTYKELLSSGNLNLISNDAIKESLLELDKKYVQIATAEYHMYREYEEYLYNNAVTQATVLNLFDFEKTANDGAIVLKEVSEISTGSPISEYNKLLNEKSFMNGLKLAVMNNVSLKAMHEELSLDLRALIELITEELPKNWIND